MAALGQDEIRMLEQTRQRLLALHTSLTALQQDLFTQQPLPSWYDEPYGWQSKLTHFFAFQVFPAISLFPDLEQPPDNFAAAI